MNFLDGAADHAIAGNIFLRSENVFGGVVGINMGGSVIDRNMFFCAVTNKSIDPCRLRGGRSADAQSWADFLKCKSGMVVELPISFLLGLAAPEIKIRLVPDFEIPLRYFVDAIPLDEMLGEDRDQVVPSVQSFGGEILGWYQKG